MTGVVAPDPLWPGLAPPEAVHEVDRFFEATATASPERRADAVAELIGRCPAGCSAAGAYETIAVELGVANSEGQYCWAPSTQASLTTVVTGPDGGSGFAEVFAGSTDAIDPGAVGDERGALLLALAGVSRVDVFPLKDVGVRGSREDKYRRGNCYCGSHC